MRCSLGHFARLRFNRRRGATHRIANLFKLPDCHVDAAQRLGPAVTILACPKFDHQEQEQGVADMPRLFDALDMSKVAAVGLGNLPLPGTKHEAPPA